MYYVDNFPFFRGCMAPASSLSSKVTHFSTLSPSQALTFPFKKRQKNINIELVLSTTLTITNNKQKKKMIPSIIFVYPGPCWW